jgi:protease-4
MSEHDGNAAEPAGGARPSGWERETIEKVLLAAIEEQRQARRWGIIFKSLLLIYLIAVLVIAARPMFEEGRMGGGKDHTALIDVVGMIAPGQPTNGEALIDALRSAAENRHTKGIVLRMNTPGGSPVQSAYVYDEIRRLKQEKPQLPIYAVVADMCASGGYYIASATDKIFVNSASVVGSIGVIMNNFGFVEAMNRLGVERRVMTAGEHKAILDPFAPVDPVAREHMQGVLNSVHRQFIDAVKQGRGDRLKETPELFSGLIWTGADGIKLGLADELGDVRHVAEKVIGAKEIVDFTPQESLLNRLAQRLGTAVGQTLATTLGSSLTLR